MSQDQYNTSSYSSPHASHPRGKIPSTPPTRHRSSHTTSPFHGQLRYTASRPTTPSGPTLDPPVEILTAQDSSWSVSPTRGVRNLTSPPSTPIRSPAAAARQAAQARSPSTPQTLRRAINTALPVTPSSHQPSAPPSAFPSRLAETNEHPLTPQSQRVSHSTDSPFDDRHSIYIEQQPIDEDPFEYADTVMDARRQEGMPGYTLPFTASPSSHEKYGSDTDGHMESRHVSQYTRPSYSSQHAEQPSTLSQRPDLRSLPSFKDTPPSSPQNVVPIPPTFRGLFYYTRPRDYLVCFLPALACSTTAALVQPFMSKIIGEAFDVFVRFPLDARVGTSADKDALMKGITMTTIKLVGAGGAALVLNYAKGALWARHGEMVVDRLRKAVFEGVQEKSMTWFDLGMGMREDDQEEGESVGAGGLMAKFTRETDDVRMGTATAFGNSLQYIVTFIACFVLALSQSPVLALVTLSTIPLVLLVQIATQILARPYYEGERRAFAEASTNVDRATAAISTVKVHNAQKSEQERFERLVGKGVTNLVKQAAVWATSMSLTDFILLSTFVVGFWYGAKVVRDGTATPGTVMTVFWACLLGATYLQMVVPQLAYITKAKNSMASLRTVIKDPPVSTISNPFSPSTSPVTANFGADGATSRPLSKIRPSRCRGEFNLRNISFAYPSRPDDPVLRDVTLFIPPGETTFIVGGSGSGKSTIAQLLLRLYVPNGGEITLDDQSFPYLDDRFCREHIAAVQQGCILFDMPIHDNVAMGLAGAGADPNTGMQRRPEDVSREEVVEACRMAMIHDFIEDLPEGYDTRLGTGGSALSGGQRQRLAIARARIRDPTVLILDEATSALDATSRVVVFENMKAWRKNKTTIVITHDLSQIVSEDFVYVMKNGVVVEQGFRSDLMRRTPLVGQNTGVFAAMAAEQAVEPLAPKLEEWRNRPEDEEVLDEEEDLERPFERAKSMVRAHTPSFGYAIGPRPESALYLDILEEYSRGARLSTVDPKATTRLSTAQKRLSWNLSQLDGRRNSRTSLVAPRSHVGSQQSLTLPSRPVSRMSRQPSYDSSNLAIGLGSVDNSPSANVSRGQEKDGRLSVVKSRNRTLSQDLEDELKTDLEIVPHLSPYAVVETPVRGLFGLLRYYFPTIPQKLLGMVGLVSAIAHGVSTPIWSFFLAKLMAIVGAGGTDPSLTKWGLVLLALSAGQGVVYWIQEYTLFCIGAKWSGIVRTAAFGRVLQQDKGWFDESANSPARLVQNLIKDADDMRQIIGSVMGKIAVFISMVGLGIIWAFVVDWRLTLVGIALAPVFAVMMLVQDTLIGKAEVANKRRREDLARTFYDSVTNVRGIRAMALEETFKKQFASDAEHAVRTGNTAAWYVAIGIGGAACMPLFAQAMLSWVGAVFMTKGYLSYPQLLQVFNLVLFSLTFGTAMLDFIPILAKAKAAARDFERVFALTDATEESHGDLRFPITGHIAFSHVQFSYPSRIDAPVLTDVSFTLSPGECVAIVGPSGSGKSTIAALLQRLYSPTSGQIILDKYDLGRADVRWLRNHIAVVSQSANLFDASVAQNIAYGSDVSLEEIRWAARAANIHDFIMSLPEGYDTNLGENASLISGGQAQRLQIARALVRRSRILILDECTSALDVDNQRMILDTIVKVKETRTTVFITHSVEAMRRCDRVICLGDGVVAEQGGFDELIARGGVFAQLMQTGEWE